MSGTMFAASPVIAMRCARFHGRQREVDAASIAIRRGNGVLAVGTAGSGVSTLLDQLASRFASRHIVRVLPDGFDAQPGSVELGRTIVVADDVDRLHIDVQRRIEQLATRRKATVIAGTTVRRCGQVRDRVRWQAMPMRQVWLDALPAPDLLAIIEDLLVGDVDAPTFKPLVELAAGVPRDVIDLLVGSHQVGLIAPTARGWALTGDPSTHLVRATTVQLVESMEREVRHVAYQLARVLPQPMRTVHAAVGTSILRQLFDAGLLHDRVGQDVTVVDFVRPLDAVLLRQRL